MLEESAAGNRDGRQVVNQCSKRGEQRVASVVVTCSVLEEWRRAA